MRAMSLKLDEEQLKLLEQASKATNIPKSVLVRKGITLVLQQLKQDVVSGEFRREVDALLSEDREVLKRLAKA